MLAADSFHTEQRQHPWLVFLHGFIGNCREWRNIIEMFPTFPCLAVDLPGHGASRNFTVNDFIDFNQALNTLLAAHKIENYYLIGYSLGGRLAMHDVCHRKIPGLHGLIVESGHPGLTDEAEKTARLVHDAQWAQRFRQEPITDVLHDWYRQPVFSDLSDEQRTRFIRERQNNYGQNVASLLMATSLGKQPCLTQKLQALSLPFLYLCGERDQKFSALAKLFPHHTVPNAGHNAHVENPKAFGREIHAFITSAT